jgi:hypothetical protein
MTKYDIRRPDQRFLDTGYLLPIPKPKAHFDRIIAEPKSDNETIDEGTPDIGTFAIIVCIVMCLIVIAAAMNAYMPM